MTLQLIDGHFESAEALEMLTQWVHTKIKFHEAKIAVSDHEEDIKNREAKIKLLQDQLRELRLFLQAGASVSLHGHIHIQSDAHA